MKNLYLLIILIVFFNNALAQQVFKVPSEYPNIQAGIDAAWDGDTVLVADGEYSGDGNNAIRFQGKRIVVKSENGPNTCIVKILSDSPSQRTAFYFTGIEDTLSVLQGIQIKAEVNFNYGVFIEYSSPKIENCIFINTGLNSRFGSPVVRNSEFKNSVTDNYRQGIVINKNSTYPIIIDNCKFENLKYDYDGAAIEITVVDVQVVISNCCFSNNMTKEYTGNGGAVYTYMTSDCVIKNSLFINNRCRNASGNAIYCDIYKDHGGTNRTVISHCVFVSNSGNDATVFLNDSSKVVNSTLYKNSGDNYFGGIMGGQVTNCILWNNTPQEIGGSDVTYSLVRRGYEGEGNFDADPLFVNPDSLDFNLQPNSPCIDAGDPNSPLDPDGTRADIGAIPYNQNATFSKKVLVNQNSDVKIFPNPTSYKVIISSAIHEIRSISLFTIDGRSLLVNKKIGSTESSIDLKQLGLNNGAYLIKIDSNSETVTRKILFN